MQGEHAGWACRVGMQGEGVALQRKAGCRHPAMRRCGVQQPAVRRCGMQQPACVRDGLAGGGLKRRSGGTYARLQHPPA